MQNDDAKSQDELTAEVSPSVEVPRESYRVTSKVGLFKNGKQYKKGSLINLDKKTAQNFLDIGDVEKATKNE